ncbi:MAG: hypothetical protein KF886_23555 [Candidatus Hydrogenedentes bacterium]|nr:hypothetical protein [Candidatus Hydrogenedentota bacterium]
MQSVPRAQLPTPIGSASESEGVAFGDPKPFQAGYFFLENLVHRREGKDVHDLVYILQRAGGEAAGVRQSVRPEELKADAFVHAMKTLRGNFESPGEDGPVRYARFLPDAPDTAIQAFAAVNEFSESLPS